MKLNKEYLRTQQYQNSEAYLSRIDLFNFGDNKENFWHWVARHYDFSNAKKILEVGCGTGSLWQFMKDKLHAQQQLILTDFSEGMLKIAKENIKNFNLPCKVNFQIADVEKLSFNEQSFDVALAHLMLYHVTSQHKALNEINRILKPKGIVGISTIALETSQEILQLAHQLDKRILPYTVAYTFPEERADYFLAEYYQTIKKFRYESLIKVTNVAVLIKYLKTYPTIMPLNLPASFFQEYANKAQRIIDEQGAFATKFNMVLYICSVE